MKEDVEMNDTLKTGGLCFLLKSKSITKKISNYYMSYQENNTEQQY